MKYLTYILFSYKGRIGRRDFWIGFTMLMVAIFFGTFLLQPNYFTYDIESDRFPPRSFGIKIFDLIMLLPSYAVTVKRFNDRDWARWVIFVVFIIALPMTIGPFFGLFLDIETATPIELTWWFVFGFLAICAIIDNGFLKGTTGLNRYGEDPLQN